MGQFPDVTLLQLCCFAIVVEKHTLTTPYPTDGLIWFKNLSETQILEVYVNHSYFICVANALQKLLLHLFKGH